MNIENSYLQSVDTIEIVLKIVERCNLNCSYCYYYHGGNHDYAKMPAVMSVETARDVGRFLAEGAKKIGVSQINLDFHGGEPMFCKKDRFVAIVEALLETLSPAVTVKFAMQTNATLVDEEWIDILCQYEFAVGVSLDGPKSYNDKYRIDHQGRGSYEQTAHGITLLKKAYDEERLRGFGALAVINEEFDIDKIYKHFVDDLGFPAVDFLLPDYTHDTFEALKSRSYGALLNRLFDLWASDYSKVEVRRLNNLVALFGGDKSNRFIGFSEHQASHIAFTIHSDGSCAPDDILRITPPWDSFYKPKVTEATLEDFLLQPMMLKMEKESRTIPEKCKECCWASICGGGGTPTHQYSSSNKSFLNESVFCESLQDFYAHVTQFLIDNGMPHEHLYRVLGIDNPDEETSVA